MSYKLHKAQVGRQRAGLRAVLEHANVLRHQAQLPSRGIEAELDARHPLLPEEAWNAQQQERKAFARFRQQQLAGLVMPTTPAEADWEQVRATGLRGAFREHQIRQTWVTAVLAGRNCC